MHSGHKKGESPRLRLGHLRSLTSSWAPQRHRQRRPVSSCCCARLRSLWQPQERHLLGLPLHICQPVPGLPVWLLLHPLWRSVTGMFPYSVADSTEFWLSLRANPDLQNVGSGSMQKLEKLIEASCKQDGGALYDPARWITKHLSISIRIWNLKTTGR